MSTANKNYPLIKETDSNGNPLNAYDQLVTESNNFRRAVDNDIKAVEDRVESTETNIDLTSNIVKASDSPVSSLRLVRNGNTIYFQCISKINNGWSNLGLTLPSGILPVVDTPLSISFSGQSDIARFGHAKVTPSGNVSTLASEETINTVVLSGTWIV